MLIPSILNTATRVTNLPCIREVVLPCRKVLPDTYCTWCAIKRSLTLPEQEGGHAGKANSRRLYFSGAPTGLRSVLSLTLRALENALSALRDQSRFSHCATRFLKMRSSRVRAEESRLYAYHLVSHHLKVRRAPRAQLSLHISLRSGVLWFGDQV